MSERLAGGSRRVKSTGVSPKREFPELGGPGSGSPSTGRDTPALVNESEFAVGFADNK